VPHYTERDWERENAALLGGRPPGPCPRCGRVGFYGPRRSGPERKWRLCTFCGFAQDVGGPEGRYRPTAHGCAAWPEVAGAPYIAWVPPDVESYECPVCGGRVTVANALVVAPADDPGHPWWRVPQDLRSATEWLALWRSAIGSPLPGGSRLYL
jgi:hypothetical protein